mmetsp:Transcript_43845/g.72910  ORF Transcript_43845/g.72910 Transcript_43845/m.72910 type:complete len:96 (+) Transcript_43845:85-372(+)
MNTDATTQKHQKCSRHFVQKSTRHKKKKYKNAHWSVGHGRPSSKKKGRPVGHGRMEVLVIVRRFLRPVSCENCLLTRCHSQAPQTNAAEEMKKSQ